MKTRIHFDIGTYEFVEFEFDKELTPEQILKLWTVYHKLTDKSRQNKVEKVNKHKLDYIEDLELPNEPIILPDND